ncbi:hypothetical protein ACP70R_005365 [Stipagrostis hirtigluma subsp. patula]
MELRPDRRPGSQPPRGARRRRRPRRRLGGDGDGVDRISGLPDDLLLQVLVRLRCARAAVRTGLLSRRWRSLWRRLPGLYFRGVAPAALEAALAQVALPNLSLLDVDVLDSHRFSADAPMLKKFTLDAIMHRDFSMSLLAPMVENHSWICSPAPATVGIDGMQCLHQLKLWTEESNRVLCLHIRRPEFSVPHPRNLQEMFQFPDFSALELHLETRGHIYGAMVLNLLRICNAIQKLKVVIIRYKRTDEACPPNCDCDQLQSADLIDLQREDLPWRSQDISMVLEEVEIENFRGSDHEVDFLKLLFRCAPLTKVIMKLASKPSSIGCKETYNIFKANPSVECYVFRKCGKAVNYA